MRMFILCLLIVAGIVIYDQVRISGMKKELNQITYQLNLTKAKVAGKQGSNVPKPVAEVRSHMEKAKIYLKQKKTADAQKELQIALDQINSVQFKAQEYLDSAGKYWKKTKSGAFEALRGAIKDIATEPQKEQPTPEPAKAKK